MKDKIFEVIVTCLSGYSTSEELQTLNKWIKESEENKKYFDEVSDIWFAVSDPGKKTEFDAFSALKTVKSKMSKGSRMISSAFNRSRQQQTRLIPVRIIKIAAVFIIALILGAAIPYLLGDFIFKSSADELTSITAPIGSKTEITLPDGTSVCLNAGSTIKYPVDFNKNNRSVELEGEAYFNVAKNKLLPYIVNTGEIRIKAVGTTFNVKAYPDEGSVETTLVSGTLIVEHVKKGKKMVLSPNQRATYFKTEGNVYLSELESKRISGTKEEKLQKIKGKILYTKGIETEVFTAWKDDRLVFRNELFESLAVKLERWFGIEIRIVNKEILDYHFNGIIENETVQDVMEIIKYALPIEYTVKHNVITIYGTAEKIKK